ncbi:MAG: metallophosphoesterase family protein [Armatimonadetes bacterium]|nr:metallophosphoesterase family protein [Armatimonadota bacterium]
MRHAIISDIHSNLPALESVLARLNREGIDHYICLGDLVGYGASPNECCDIVRALEPSIVRGNHDYAAVQPGGERWFTPAARACILWTRDQLTDVNRDFLGSLKPFVDIPGAHLCHGSLFDADYYTTTPFEAAASLRVMTQQLCFFGHTHYAEWFSSRAGQERPDQFAAPDGATLRLEDGAKYMVNPGAVGQPRDGNSQAGYAIWDDVTHEIILCRVPYNIRAAQEKMEQAGLPWNMAERLNIGV